ncbi:MAG TPA: TonB-dependent receptor, partial [Longimicrobiales bacterium]|nr:TonB-dependent receptor [Longimicrobiales bacterium]
WAQELPSTGARTGVISGRVVDVDSRAPLAGVSVRVSGTDLGAWTDSAGAFRIGAVPVGSRSVEYRLLGYGPLVQADVVVRTGRPAVLEAELRVRAIELEAVVVKPSYFPVPDAEPVSAVSFSAEEVRRAPGSAGDVSRILMSLPSVAKVNDQSNGLVVRGGSPAENIFLVDGIEVPNINHFPTQGASSGPIGILNADLIRDVKLYAGAFDATFGDRLSSVMDIRLRDGDRDRLHGQADVGFAGFGGVLEGPLSGGGSWLVAVRRSYVDLLVRAFDVGATVAPRYGDYVGKASYDVGGGHRLSFLAVWADDHMHADLAQARANAMTYFGDQDIVEGTTGASWSALWSERAHSTTTLAWTTTRYDEAFRETGSGLALLRNRSREGALRLRNVNRLELARAVSLELGLDGVAVWASYDNVYAAHVGPLGEPEPERVVASDPRGLKAGVFASLSVRPWPALAATLGLRADGYTVTGNTTWSPRASASYRLGAATWLSAGAGVFRQSLPLVLLAQGPATRALADPQAVHYVVGLSHLLAADTRLTVEAYRKDYGKLPLDPSQPALFPLDELYYDYGFFTVHDSLMAAGRASSVGLEATVQKKLARDVYGLASVGYSSVRYRGADGAWRDRVYDNRVVASVEGGYKPGTAWELSARWIYAGGPPYTPMDLAASRAVRRAVLDASQVNAARYPAYHSLNVRVDRRFYFGHSDLVAYLSVWNAYDRRNVAAYYWNVDEGRAAPIYQWGMLPVFGVEYAF